MLTPAQMTTHQRSGSCSEAWCMLALCFTLSDAMKSRGHSWSTERQHTWSSNQSEQRLPQCRIDSPLLSQNTSERFGRVSTGKGTSGPMSENWRCLHPMLRSLKTAPQVFRPTSGSKSLQFFSYPEILVQRDASTHATHLTSAGSVQKLLVLTFE